MQRFWDCAVLPLLKAIRPQTIVEIGAAEGGHTRQLLEFCAANDAILHSIDPAPRFDVEALRSAHDGRYIPHRANSLDVLTILGPCDVALIDGDHNWYTVFNELRLIKDAATRVGALPPVVLCHDICWPYGRRDLYYDPASIPDAYRQPFVKGGVVPGHAGTFPGRGLNAHLHQAAREGGERNGVLTAIEDFLILPGVKAEFHALPVLYGLGIVLPEGRATANSTVRSVMTDLLSVSGWERLATLAEQHRAACDMARQHLRRQLDAIGPRNAPPGVSRQQSDGFSSALPPDVLGSIQAGVLRTTYRGLRFLKSPFDVVIYQQLLDRLRPATVVEIGTLQGGSALWFADQMQIRGIEPRVISIDRHTPEGGADSRIRFLEGEAGELAPVLDAYVPDLPRPWLVIEDSAHTFEATSAVLAYFDPLLSSGDYIVVEDGIVRDMPGDKYRQYNDGPNRAVRQFLERRGDDYEVDTDLCDYFGSNFTFNPRGYIRRTR